MTSAGKREPGSFAWQAFVFIAFVAVVMIAVNLVGVLLPAWRSSQASKIEVEISGRTMGTSYSVKAWYGETPATQEQIDERLIAINQQMSTYLS